LPNNHTQILDIHCHTKAQTKEIMTLLQGKNGDIDFNSIVPCQCYACNPDKVKLPKKCQEEMHFSCKKCDKAFKDAGISKDEWYGAHIDTWGTKWNACDVSLSGITKSKWKKKGYKFTINYNFWTAWAPPEEVYNALAQILEDKYERDVLAEVTCYDEFVWIPDDESKEDTGYHIDPEQLYYWNSSPHFRGKGFLNPHPYQEEYTIKTHKENHQIINMDELIDKGLKDGTVERIGGDDKND
jgi:hypothetical protein